jgi:hypothetical protein
MTPRRLGTDRAASAAVRSRPRPASRPSWAAGTDRTPSLYCANLFNGGNRTAPRFVSYFTLHLKKSAFIPSYCQSAEIARQVEEPFTDMVTDVNSHRTGHGPTGKDFVLRDLAENIAYFSAHVTTRHRQAHDDGYVLIRGEASVLRGSHPILL